MKLSDFVLTSRKYRLTPRVFIKDCGEWINPFKHTVIINFAKLHRHIKYTYKVDGDGYYLPMSELLIFAKSRQNPTIHYVVTYDKRHYCRMAKTERSYGVAGLIGSWKETRR